MFGGSSYVNPQQAITITVVSYRRTIVLFILFLYFIKALVTSALASQRVTS